MRSRYFGIATFWATAVLLFYVVRTATIHGKVYAQVSPPAQRLILDMVHHNPGEPRTATSFLDPALLADRGYNVQVMDDYLQAAVTFEAIQPGLFPAGSPARQWIDARAAGIDQQIAAAHAAGLKIFFNTDFIVLPKSLVALRGSELCDAEGRVDPHRDFTKRVLRAMLAEMFQRFSGVDGLVVRTGEVYTHDLPFHQGNNPILRGRDSHVVLLDLLREELCVKRDKWLIYRTWDVRPNGFHSNPDYYLSVTDAITPHPKLIFSIKHQAGDFQRMTPFNPTLMIGRHPQIVEVQCQREAEGKGSSPDYIGQGVIDGWEEYNSINPSGRPKGLRDIASDPHFAGIWTWSRGGGWEGPYIRNELWCDLNAYVVAKWAQDPRRPESEIFEEFAGKRGIMGEDAARFRRLCLLSAEAIVRGRMSMSGHVNPWWTRDDFVGGIPTLAPFLDKTIERNSLENVLSEKADAVERWRDMEDLSREIHTLDPALDEYLVTSTTYGRIQYEIYQQAWTVMLYGRKGDRTGKYDWDKINSAIASYDTLWQAWHRLKDNSPSCATLYHDTAFQNDKRNGIGASIDQYRPATAQASARLTAARIR